jgi:hypothetical protein
MLLQIQILTNEIYCYLFFSVLNAAEDDEGGPNVGYVGVGPGPITEKKV